MRQRLFYLMLVIPCALVGFLSLFWLVIAAIAGHKSAWPMFRAYDRIGNALTGGNDLETISERANRGRKQGLAKWCLLCWMLDKIDPNHCEKSGG